MKVVTKKCLVCQTGGIVRLPDTPEAQMALDRWHIGEILIQQAFPDLEPALREQMISGVHPDCWTELFGNEEEEE